MSRFTVLIPVHNEADNIAPLHAELARELGHLDHEVIVINDGSTDATGAELTRHAPEWTILDTPRLGKSRALELGLARVTTDSVVMMDGDLQDDTTAIPALLADIEAGADCAVGCRARRRDGWLIKRFPSFFFNLYLSLLFGFRFLDINTGLKAFRTDALRRITWFENCHRFFPLLVFRSGGHVTQRPVHHRPRHAGSAKFNHPLRFIGGFIQGLLLRAGHHDPRPRTTRVAQLLPLCAALICGASFFHWAARDGWFLHVDSPAFIPPMLSYAHNGTLVNTYQPSALLWDSAGKGRQVGHGFLPSIASGALSPGTTYRDIHYTLAGIASLALLLFATLLNRTLPSSARLGGMLPAIGVVAAAGMLIRIHGRPETFVFMIAVASAWLWISLGRAGRLATAGIALSALAMTSPVAAVLAGLIFLAFLSETHPARLLLPDIITTGIITAAGIVAWFALYPYPVADWLHGHITHASTTVVKSSQTTAFFSASNWFLRISEGLPGPIFVLGVTSAWFIFSRPLRPMTAVCMACFVAASWYFGLRQGFPTYNLDWLVPFAVIPIIWRISRQTDHFRRHAFLLGTAVLLTAPGYVFAARQYKIYLGARFGPPAGDIRQIAGDILASPSTDRLYLSRHYFQLLPPDTRLVRYEPWTSAPPAPRPKSHLIISQADARSDQPPALVGWRLQRHNYNTAPRPIPYSACGFFYALYVFDDTLLSQLQTTGSDKAASNQ